MPVNLGTGIYLRLPELFRNVLIGYFLTVPYPCTVSFLYKLPPACRLRQGQAAETYTIMNYYILIPVLLRLSTKPFCAYRYSMISGTITIRVPVASIQLV